MTLTLTVLCHTFITYLSDKADVVGKYLTLQVKVVDVDGRMVPFGSAGELWVRSYCVTPGYWDEKEKTDELIQPDGWLKTG